MLGNYSRGYTVWTEHKSLSTNFKNIASSDCLVRGARAISAKQSQVARTIPQSISLALEMNRSSVVK